MTAATPDTDAINSIAETIPRIISVDDHVLEPPDLWVTRVGGRHSDRAPRVLRQKGREVGRFQQATWVADPDLPGAKWCDVWYYDDDYVRPIFRGMAQSGYENEDALLPITYDDVLPAAYRRDPRLELMDENHTEASLCFPSVVKFCGQMFLSGSDRRLALECLQAYNDWMIEEWCSGPAYGRLLPLTLVPLWDAELAATEVRRCADKGSHAIAFTECPTYLGLPSLYSGYWDPMFGACAETDTVINIHVGSSSQIPDTAPDDGPADLKLCVIYVNSLLAYTDLLYSGALERFPSLKVALSESQAGWVPFAQQRVDNTWTKGSETWMSEAGAFRAQSMPSAASDRIFLCIFDDLVGLRQREHIGLPRLLFETDFPHADSSYPHTVALVKQLIQDASLTSAEVYSLLRGNAIQAFGLDKYFGIER